MNDDDTTYTITSGATVGNCIPAPADYKISISGSDLDNSFSNISTGEFTYTIGDTDPQFDQTIIDSNPTLKKLWEQFNYVYSIVEADRDNEDVKWCHFLKIEKE